MEQKLPGNLSAAAILSAILRSYLSQSVFKESNPKPVWPFRSLVTPCPSTMEVDPRHLAVRKGKVTWFKGNIVFFDEFKVARPRPVTESQTPRVYTHSAQVS